MTLHPSLTRFMQKRIGKNLMIVGEDTPTLEGSIREIFSESKKRENKFTMYDHHRLMAPQYKGWERREYWRDTIRHHDQKKVSFFVTSVLARKKISVPLR